jgi:large subunit ribosomal protein L24
MIAKIRTGDRVIVISGKFKGQAGQILSLFYHQKAHGFEKYVQISGIGERIVKRKNKEGKYEEQLRRQPLALCKVAFCDPDLDIPTRIGIRKNESGIWERFSKKTEKTLEEPLWSDVKKINRSSKMHSLLNASEKLSDLEQ